MADLLGFPFKIFANKCEI